MQQDWVRPSVVNNSRTGDPTILIFFSSSSIPLSLLTRARKHFFLLSSIVFTIKSVMRIFSSHLLLFFSIVRSYMPATVFFCLFVSPTDVPSTVQMITYAVLWMWRQWKGTHSKFTCTLPENAELNVIWKCVTFKDVNCVSLCERRWCSVAQRC